MLIRLQKIRSLSAVFALTLLASCATTEPALLSRQVADAQLLGQWGTNAEMTTTTLVTFRPDGQAEVRNLPGSSGLLNGTYNYQTSAPVAGRVKGTLGTEAFSYTIEGKELTLALEGASGLTLLNRLKDGPPVVRLDALGEKIADSPVAGVWYFQGRGAGWASGASQWADSSVTIDAVKHKIVYRWRANNEGLKTWSHETVGVEGEILNLSDGELVYRVKYAKNGKDVNSTVTALYRFMGDDPQWIWASPDVASWNSYAVYARARP